MRARLTLAILTACCLIGASGVLAQDATSDAGASGTEASASSAREDPSDTDGAGYDRQTADGASPDVFIPTEEISEDFAVAFPVDI